MSTLAQAAARVAAAPLGGIRAAGAALRVTALVVLAAVTLAGAYVTWVRDLPIFSVSSVEVSGTDDGLIVSTLTSVAREMTTLHVSEHRFDEVAEQFPVISAIHTETSFPSGMRIAVEIREPVAIAQIEGEDVPVSAEGVLLEGVRVPERLPVVTAEADNGYLAGRAVDQVRVIGAAPGPLAALIESVRTTKASGIAIRLEGGVEVRFGTPGAATRKWAAAAAVLADGQLTGLTYVDVSVPDRPAVGGAQGGPPIEVEVEVAPVEAGADTASAAEITTEEPAAGTTGPATPETLPQATPEGQETAPLTAETAPAGAITAP